MVEFLDLNPSLLLVSAYVVALRSVGLVFQRCVSFCPPPNPRHTRMPCLTTPHVYFNPPLTEALDLAGVSEYIAALKAMGAAAPAGIDDATLATLLEGEAPEEVCVGGGGGG